jgi:hypothetical protein
MFTRMARVPRSTSSYTCTREALSIFSGGAKMRVQRFMLFPSFPFPHFLRPTHFWSVEAEQELKLVCEFSLFGPKRSSPHDRITNLVVAVLLGLGSHFSLPSCSVILPVRLLLTHSHPFIFPFPCEHHLLEHSISIPTAKSCPIPQFLLDRPI